MFNDYNLTTKVKEITEASASVGLLLATALLFALEFRRYQEPT